MSLRVQNPLQTAPPTRHPVFKHKTTVRYGHSSVCLPGPRTVRLLKGHSPIQTYLSQQRVPNGTHNGFHVASYFPPFFLAFLMDSGRITPSPISQLQPCTFLSFLSFMFPASPHPQHCCHVARNSCARPSPSPGLLPLGPFILPSSSKYVLSLCRVPGTGLGSGES